MRNTFADFILDADISDDNSDLARKLERHSEHPDFLKISSLNDLLAFCGHPVGRIMREQIADLWEEYLEFFDYERAVK